MSDSLVSLRHKIASAQELGTVVRTMKTMAASSINQYENAVHALDDYYRTLQLGLAACFHEDKGADISPIKPASTKAIGVIVFGSDQGLVGQFNDVIVDYAMAVLENLPGNKIIWAVGERIQARLEEYPLMQIENIRLPNSINAVSPLVGQLLIAVQDQLEKGLMDQVYLFYNHPRDREIYTPESQKLLPLDETWRHELATIPWPTKHPPEVMNNRESTLRALIREYLFVTLFRAFAESLASENASRLAAMQRAEKNIDELQEHLKRTFYRLRQSDIDEELFDVISGFEALGSDE